MQPIPGTETLHPWAQLAGAIAFAIVMGALMAWSQFRGRREAMKSKAQSEDAARSTATALVAVTPTADRLTQDTLIQMLAAIRDTLERINDRMEKDEIHREAAKEAELLYLRRLVNEIRPAPYHSNQHPSSY